MVTEKSCNLSEYQVDLPQEEGSGTNWASSDEYLPKKYLQMIATYVMFDVKLALVLTFIFFLISKYSSIWSWSVFS